MADFTDDSVDTSLDDPSLDELGAGDDPSLDTGDSTGENPDPGAATDAAAGDDPSQSIDNMESDAPPDGSSNVLEFDDGSSYDADNQIYTDPDGVEHTVEATSPDGTVLQFDDGSVLDTNTGTMYASMNDFINDDGSGETSSASSSNNGAGSARGNGLASSGGGAGGGKPSGGGSSSQNNALQSLASQVAKLGASMASLLKTKPVPAKSTAKKPVTPLTGKPLNNTGTIVALVLFAGLMLLIVGGSQKS